MNTPTPVRPLLLRISITLVLVILLLLLFKQQADLARLKKNIGELQSQNTALLNNTLQPQQVAEPALTATQENVTLPPAAHPPEPERNRLEFIGTDVTQTTNGLVAIMRFKATKTGPLGLVAMSVRLPHNLGARIHSLSPVDPAKFSDSDATVAESGLFAFFQGTVGDEAELQIALAVSGPAQAFIKGSRGIPAMQLDIQPTQATAVKP